MNILKPYDLSKKKRQVLKHLKLDIFLKTPKQKNSDKTSDELLPSTSSGETQKPPALFF
jgi:hypothetical protein